MALPLCSGFCSTYGIVPLTGTAAAGYNLSRVQWTAKGETGNEKRTHHPAKVPAGRYALLDELRGLDLVSMMLYHACWDMMFLFGIWMD